MQRLLAIALAGMAGALLRYGIGTAIGPRSFPWATLLINVAGSFALGYVLGGPGRRWNPDLEAAVVIGLLGAFTTYSTFAFEVTGLLREDRPITAAGYVVVSVLVGVTASALGFTVGRSQV